MQAVQRNDIEALMDQVKQYFKRERLNVSIQSFDDDLIRLSGNVPIYYARQKIQQAIMRIMPKGIRLNDDNITVGSYEEMN